jgi:CDP-6-deoxy-D-xylo-4-hexulose-3-dehydrase
MSRVSEKEDREEIFNLVKKFAENYLQAESFQPGKTAIPPSGKLIGNEELVAMVDASLDGWLTAGRYNRSFERRLSKFLGAKHVLTVNSGSSANLVAFSCLTSPKLGERAIQKGDEVISVAAGFPTTVNPILQFGAIPVFIDVTLENYNIDVKLVESAISSKTKAIMLAHTLGNPFDLDVITSICKKHNLWLIEDTCDALGSTYKNQKVGTYGDVGTISFYPAHHITMGEGGAVFTNNDELRAIAESYRDWGRDCYCQPGRDNTCGKRFGWQLGSLPCGYDHKYTYSHIGYNLKISDMQAACGLAQLKKVEEFIAARKRNFEFLKTSLSELEDVLLLPKATKYSDPSWFGFPLTVKSQSPLTRMELINELEKNRIGTRLLFAGNLTRQPSMIEQKFKIPRNLDVTDTIMNDTFWVGIHPALTEEMLAFTAEIMTKSLRR